MGSARILLFFIFNVFLGAPGTTLAEQRKTPEPELRICSQNAHNLGPSKSEAAIDVLAQRILNSRCDIIALQEVVGETKSAAAASARLLSRAIKLHGGNEFQLIVGEANNSPIRNAFLYSPGIVVLEKFESFARENLPMLQKVSKARRSLRGPDAVLFRHIGPNHPSQYLYLVTFHFKSKVQGWKDPTGTQFEATRLEMGEGLRRAIDKALPMLPPDTLVLMLGDRNSEPGSASAEVLAGKHTIDDFRSPKGCRIDKNLKTQCQEPVTHDAQFVSVLTESDVGGSYRYKGHQMFLDDILVRRSDRWVTTDNHGAPMSGVSGVYGKGSDHKLLWVELNW